MSTHNVLALPPGAPLVAAQTTLDQSALVLVNSASPSYADFQQLIQPYLDYLGIPYTLLDISKTQVTATVGGYALLVIGHRSLDVGATRYLDAAEQGYISAAVQAGTGLVNFDNDLSVGGAARYGFIDGIFHFGYNTSTSGSGVTFGDPSLNYIIARHTVGEAISTGTMRLAGITLPAAVTALATSGSQPFVAVTSYGSGRAVQFGSYDWISHAVKGPLFGLDDLVWRSMVWAARKPFVMRGLPPFATMRMDDTIGPLDWVHIANEYGFIPWLGIFPENMAGATIADLKSLVDNKQATTALHAWASGTSHFFYFDHNNGQNYSDATMATNFADGSAWFQTNGITMSKFLVPHYYEIGSNALSGVENWGIQYIGTMMDPGQLELQASWMNAGPFRLYENGQAYDKSYDIYYADFVPGTNQQLFNCVTELRDITGYEWLGTSGHTSVAAGIADGTETLTRSFDSMVLGTLFSHEYAFVPGMSMTDWRSIISGISQNISSYRPQYVSMDYACQYVRALKTSQLVGASYDFATRTVTASFSGAADLATQYYVFNDAGGVVTQTLVNGISSVPAFTNGTVANFTLPGALDHITVTPASADVIAGTTRQFTATGYDAQNNPIPDLPFTWSVTGGGGTINANGLFTAGLTPGGTVTVQAAVGSITGTATVHVIAATLDHFTIDVIASPQYAGLPFQVTVRAVDAAGVPVVTYAGTASLSASSGTVTPSSINFANGVWTGTVTIPAAGSGRTLRVQDGTAVGTSNAFDVSSAPACPCTIWNGGGTPTNANESDSSAIEVGTKFRSAVSGYITGLKFYKGSSNTGTHTGQLYAVDGTLLASDVFTGETASGWQTLQFTTPVAITAGTTYVAAYHSPSGYYAYTANYFGSAVSSPPLTALADGTDGSNGLFIYSAEPAFPNASYQMSNYWVDVVFATSIGPDTTPPTVTGTSPVNNASGVNVNANLTAAFSEPILSSSVTSTTFTLHDGAGKLVSAAVTYNSETRSATLDPSVVLPYSTTFTATLKGGTGGISDLASNNLAANYTWAFTTTAAPPPPPDEGPGGPILVVTTAGDPFSRYFAEILRTEGLNEFTATDINNVNVAAAFELQCADPGRRCRSATPRSPC